jgi:hypothetical protein
MKSEMKVLSTKRTLCNFTPRFEVLGKYTKLLLELNESSPKAEGRAVISISALSHLKGLVWLPNAL